jgi:hypothetical protein
MSCNNYHEKTRLIKDMIRGDFTALVQKTAASASTTSAQPIVTNDAMRNML